MMHVFHFVPALALTFLLKDFENSSSSFIAHRSSMNRLTAWYLYGPADFLEIRIGTCSDSKKKKEKNTQKGPSSIPTGIASCLNTIFPIVK